jgi:D-alanyl-D-alanine dipeptidase
VFTQSSPSELVNIKELIPDIVLDLRYNTTNNFVTKYSGVKHKLYTTDECFVAKIVAERLVVIQDSLRKRGMGLKLYDGYRPRSVQYFMWDILPVEYRSYLANPDNGSHHNRGAAVDLTIILLPSKEELQMPTDFDYFGPEASHDYVHPNPIVNQNRQLLRSMMIQVGGFTEYVVEWWHYQYPPATSYPLLDFQPR